MSRLWRWFKRLVLVVLVLVLVLLIAVGGLFTWLVARGMPQRDGVAHIPGLSAEVRVVRDANGVPNIYASTTHDLFAAQGYVHASERMWQMEVWRRIGSGRLSELFGDASLDNDKFIRTLGWRQAAEADWTVISDSGKEALQAYADGVNAWLDQHGDLPLPFVIAGFQGAGGGLAGFHPEHWTPIDSLTWQKVQAWSLGDNYGVELTRSVMQHRGLTTEQINQLTPGYDPSRPVVAPSATLTTQAPSASRPATHLSVATATRMLGSADALRQTIALAGGGAALAGSNGIVVAPTRSASGGALLANDPHLDISMPSVWYEVGLHCVLPASPSCPYELAGVGFPGIPGIVLGHNARISWGFTNVGPDTQDIFEEHVDPADQTRYLYKGQSLPFDVRTETIKVAGGDPVTIEVRRTVHGPVMDDVEDAFAPIDEGGADLGFEGYVHAMAWAATMQPDKAIDGILALNRAANWDEFRAAARDFGAPSQTWLYADVDGHIGVQIPGWFPIRASGDGSYPVSGEDGAHDWTGFVPFDELPYLYDPPGGIIVAANNQPEVPGSGPFIGKDFDPGFRAARISELLGTAATPITTDLLRSIQGDVKLTRAAPVVAAVAALPESANADTELLRQRIIDWATDLTCTTASKGCAAYEAFEYWLLRYTFQDELGAGAEPTDAGWRYIGTEPSHEFIGILADQPHNAWWDDVSTPGTEGRDAIISRALDRAAAELRTTQGDAAFWEWGRIHTVTFQEQTLGTSGIGPLEWIFNKGPFGAPGSCTTVLKTCGSIAKDWPPEGEAGDLQARFATRSSPSYRLVVDMSDLDGATILFTTGESGVPFDAHYGDFISRWLENSPFPLNWTSGAVDAAGTQTLMLEP